MEEQTSPTISGDDTCCGESKTGQWGGWGLSEQRPEDVWEGVSAVGRKSKGGRGKEASVAEHQARGREWEMRLRTCKVTWAATGHRILF